jgi:hypothetical protein
MPALSKKQQKFMGIVRSIQKGEQPASKFSKDARDAAKDMKKSSVKKFASTKHKGLPMKKEILGKLKEMIKQELSEYTYGVGDIVKDVNPTCPHHGAQGKVKSVGPRSVVFVVMNKGKNFEPGMELEKSHDQMKKIGESVNELKKSTVDMMDALLKIKNPMPKEIESALIMMAKGYGLDYVKREVKKNPKDFYKNLKQMAAAFPEFRNKPKDYKFEGFASAAQRRAAFASGYKAKGKKKKTNEELSKVTSGREFTNGVLTAIELITKQANNLKGPLSRHPIKRNVRKIKAVENIFKKFLKPELDNENRNFEGVNLTSLKKRLADGKFKAALEYELIPAIKPNSFRGNSFFFLDDKLSKLIKKLSDQLQSIVNQLDKAALENINENKVYKVGDTISLLSFDRRHRGKAKVKGVTKSRANKFGIKNHYITNKGTFTDMEVEGTEAFKLRFKGDTEKKVTKAMNSPYGVVLPEEINEKKKMFPPKKMTPKQAKEYKKFIDYAKMGIEYQIDMSLFESVNEDGHTDVASSKRKVMIMVQDSNKLLNKLNGMNKEDSLPSWWTDKITLSQNYLAKAKDYLLNPVESVNEFRNKREADTALDQIGPKALYMIGAKDFIFGNSGGKKSLVFKIMRNSKGVSHIRMRLTSLDLYDLEFLAIRAGKIKVKSTEKGVYGDQLGVMIKKNTGLNVRL